MIENHQASSYLEASNLSKSFGEHKIFDHLSFKIPSKQITAITGPSGSGKSTLLNILGMIERPDAGSVRLNGKDLPKAGSNASSRLIRHEISYLFQNYALVDTETVEKNLEYALHYQKGSRKEKKEKIRQALAEVGLAGFEKRKVFELSGGEQQRTALARALLKPGGLILADEPTGALDEKKPGPDSGSARSMHPKLKNSHHCHTRSDRSAKSRSGYCFIR